MKVLKFKYNKTRNKETTNFFISLILNIGLICLKLKVFIRF
ncbi:hypothetical protein [Campylobacter phage CJLB-12]|nr:hypothetical protein [Campylobacter phage CJLB-12]